MFPDFTRPNRREEKMVISVNISDGTEQILAKQAALRGQSVESYAAELIRKGVIGSRSFAEILAPFRDQIDGTQITDAELENAFEDARNEVHAANQGQE
jgi:hypothetical protein